MTIARQSSHPELAKDLCRLRPLPPTATSQSGTSTKALKRQDPSLRSGWRWAMGDEARPKRRTPNTEYRLPPERSTVKITGVEVEITESPVKHVFRWRQGLPGSGTVHIGSKLTITTDEGV